MRYRPMGNSGFVVSVAGLGCNNFGRRLDLDATRGVVNAAIDAGITLLDTAESYGGGRSEEMLGEVLTGRRDQVVLATKFGSQASTWATVRPPVPRVAGVTSCVRSSSRCAGCGPTTSTSTRSTPRTRPRRSRRPSPHWVTWLPRARCATSGTPTSPGWQIAEAAGVARELGTTGFVSAQNHWSLLERAAEAEVVPAARHFGLGVLPYFPLANGLLTGKVRRGVPPPAGSRLAGRPDYITDQKLDTVEALIGWAQQHGVTVLEVAIGGLAAQPGCASVIAGATSPEQVKANAEAAGWTPTADELADLDRVVPGPAASA